MLMQDINDRNCIYMQGVYGNSVSSAQFFYKPCCSVAKSCPTLCNPMKRIMPRFPALHNLLELVPTHVCRVGDAIQLSHPLFPLSSCLQFFPASESSPMSWFFMWPKDWRFSFSISLSNEYSGFNSFRIDWFDLLAVQGILKSLWCWHHGLKASILHHSAFFMVQLSRP